MFVLSFGEIIDLFLEIQEAMKKHINKEQEKVLNYEKEQLDKGKIPIKVGFENKIFYSGVFCDKNSLTLEQIGLIEDLNKQVLRELDSIFKKCENLSCTYNALKKYLPILNEEDIIKIEELKKKIIDNSTSKYIDNLSDELKKIYQLLRYIRCYEKNEENTIIKMYDYEAVKLEYRKLHLLYRCCKAVLIWQEENLEVYIGWRNPHKVELITEEQIDLIRNRLNEFKVQSKKFHTSEIVTLILDADETGKCNDELLEKIKQSING